VNIIGHRKSLITDNFEAFQSASSEDWLAGLLLLVALSLAGCQGVPPAAIPSGSEPAGIYGTVSGGQQPVTGATIQLYSPGNSGDGSVATPLLTQPTTTDSSGSFNITGLYQCPTPASEVYLVATGGNPGLGNGKTNAQIAMMAALGPCGGLTTSTYVSINEVTTVAAVLALAPYMQTYSAIGSNAMDAQTMSDSFTMATELANTGTGSTPGASVPTGQVVPSQKLITLADILSNCINSPGGTSGDLSSCGNLFSLVSPGTGGAPADTVGALLDIAQNPTNNVVSIFNLDPPEEPFEPSLASVPADWTLAVTSPTPTPAFSPSPGTYTVLPSVTLSDSNPSVAIYYTTDGSQPSSTSIPYVGTFALSGITTIRTIAIAGGISSLLAAGTYALAPTISLTPGSVTLTPSQTQAFTATVANTSNTAVTWSLSPAVGSISAAGLYTAPTSITSSQTITVTATSVADATKSASASISLSPHEVDLSWNAPSSSADPVAGYKVYRSSNSGSTYQLLNSSVDTATTYADTTVMAGQTYDYIVESVDAAGYTSLPSNMFSVTVP
jgi:hypothetical protein